MDFNFLLYYNQRVLDFNYYNNKISKHGATVLQCENNKEYKKTF